MRPDDMTPEDEFAAHVAHQARAMQVARSLGYDSIIDAARGRYGYVEAFTILPPAEYLLAQWRLERTNEYYRPRLERARSQRERDAIAEDWHAATAYDERLVGA